jgi:hypothetical protein
VASFRKPHFSSTNRGGLLSDRRVTANSPLLRL